MLARWDERSVHCGAQRTRTHMNSTKKNKKWQGKKITKIRSVGLKGCPQKKGVCLRVFICSPKKTISARRKTFEAQNTKQPAITPLSALSGT